MDNILVAFEILQLGKFLFPGNTKLKLAQYF